MIQRNHGEALDGFFEVAEDPAETQHEQVALRTARRRQVAKVCADRGE
jgi:hypothetical protein